MFVPFGDAQIEAPTKAGVGVGWGAQIYYCILAPLAIWTLASSQPLDFPSCLPAL